MVWGCNEEIGRVEDRLQERGKIGQQQAKLQAANVRAPGERSWIRGCITKGFRDVEFVK